MPLARSDVSDRNPAIPSVIPTASKPQRSSPATLLYWIAGERRLHGAFRYQCPVTASYVLVSDERTLKRLTFRGMRLRCPCCGETHHLVGESEPIVRPKAAS